MNSLRFVQVPVLAYHKIGWPTELGITTVLPQAFERQMEFLAQEGYQSISPDQLLVGLSEPRALTDRSVLITFDDGYASVYQHAYPVMQELGLRATVFMTAGYVGQPNSWEVPLAWKRSRHLTWSELGELAQAGFTIGAHGLFHRFLTHVQELDLELGVARTQLQSHLQQPIDYLAYPYGACNHRVLEATQRLGYRAAFLYQPQDKIEHPYLLPRLGVYLHDSLRAFQAKLGLRGFTAFRWECLKHRVIHSFTYANLMRPRYWFARSTGTQPLASG